MPLEWKENGRLDIIGQVPEWFQREFDCFENTISSPREISLSAEEFSPFLENFIIDAETFWQERSSQLLRSGIWTEKGKTGNEICLEATALFIDNRRIVLVESSEQTRSEKFQWLQTARQGQLDVISEQKISETQRLSATYYDTLTGLANRMFFLSRLEDTYETFQWNQKHPFALVVINLNRFQILNNGLGSYLGDQLLVKTAQRILKCLRQQDIPGRSGADEFSILLSDVESAQEAEVIVERILASIRLPLLIDLQKICLTASAGIALSTPQHHRALDMLRDANIAMHHAKSLGQGRYAVFDPEMRAQAFELWNLERALGLAIEQDELQLWYQPIVNTSNNCIESFEALLRWHHPSYGWVSPSKFIPLAEEVGLIIAVDNWVINRTCQTLKDWQMLGHAPVQVNINISARHFTDGDLFRTLQQALSRHGIDPQQLRLEIPEGSLVKDAAIAINILTNVKSLGLSVAIDDFGTGYASLSYLQDLPLDYLKIDGYFVETMEIHSADVINTIIDLAHKLDLNVTAERVETFEQYNMLKQLGCDTVQGYLFSKALPESAAQSLIGSEVIVLK